MPFMNSDTIYKTSTDGPEATKTLGAKLAHLLRGGEFLELASDLGGGKTTFVKGLVEAMGFAGEVTSPSFTISRVYPVRDNLAVHHFDFYRLHGHDIVTDELAEVTKDPLAIVAVEWAVNAGNKVLPNERIKVSFELGASSDDRTITVQALSSKYEYVIKGLNR
jgi:tRNA threonylcarbamoyladenosine biosynthesis protein TsaE